MEKEERDYFQLNALPLKPNSALVGHREVGVYYHNDPKSKSIMLNHSDNTNFFANKSEIKI